MEPAPSSGTCSLEIAAARLGVSRWLAYSLAQQGRFPVRILRIGRLYRVPIADLERALGHGGDTSQTLVEA